MREIRPGVILTACQPFSVITVNPEDAPGASPTHPKVLYTGISNAFVHSARWPRNGRDKFALIGGETNFTGQCDGANGEQRLAARGIDAGDQRVIGAVLGEHDGGTLTHVALLHRLADVVQRHRPVHIDEFAVLPEHIEELAKVLVRHRSSPVLARIAAMSFFGESHPRT
jgi:hypothetical protein